jgi:replicative DNA helicase
LSDVLLPHDTQAEVGIIATLIVSPEYCIQLSWFKADYFYHMENKCLYWAITELAKQDINNIDDFNIIKKINENKGVKGVFEELKIPSIQELLDNYKIVARQSFEEYKMLVNRVTNLAYKRRAYKVANEFSKICLKDDNTNLNDLNLKFHEEMNKLAEKFIINHDITLIGDVIDDVWAEIEQQRQGGLIGIPSKYDFLNEYFTYQNSELVVVGGRLFAA